MKTRVLSYLLALSTCLLLCSCLDDDRNERKIIKQQKFELTVASKLVPGSVYGGCGNIYVSDVYAGRKEQSSEWSAYWNIAGFEYEPGNEYRILVEETTYEDHLMGEPVWTESQLLKILSKEARNSEDVPEHLLPKQYYENETFVPEYRFAVEAEQKELIEKDLKENLPFMVGASVIAYGRGWSRWIALDKEGRMLGNGDLKSENVAFSSFPDSYKLLPLKGVQGYQQWTFLGVNDKEQVSFDAFISREPIGGSPANIGLTPWLYKDVTAVYKAKYPAAGVKTVVYSLGLPIQLSVINE
ncbi:DUF4377 domain-containing protein [Alistipes sp.]|uniref:DUF4377 domain-containing protein n=1 Tax=Alistipes sp. TaxID=1872444 RepID=UPI0025C6C9E3|nr:DUF4377 domain-containing protein [Alistipes sp.]